MVDRQCHHIQDLAFDSIGIFTVFTSQVWIPIDSHMPRSTPDFLDTTCLLTHAGHLQELVASLIIRLEILVVLLPYDMATCSCAMSLSNLDPPRWREYMNT